MTTGESWAPLLEELNTQRDCLNMMSTAWVTDYRSRGGNIFCGKGCQACCTLTVNCTLTEAVALAQILTDEQAHAVAAYAVRLGEMVTPGMELKEYLRMQRRVMGPCPLLGDGGACTAYAARPLACRALLSTKESFYCGVDFADLTSDEKQTYIESLDRSVTEFPLHYVAFSRDTGREFETRALTLMRQRFGFSVYGALPVLLHLVRSYSFADVVSADQESAESVAVQAGMYHPFLVELSP